MRQRNFYRWNLSGGTTCIQLLPPLTAEPTYFPGKQVYVEPGQLLVSCLPAQAKQKGSTSAGPGEAPDTWRYLPAGVSPCSPTTVSSHCVPSHRELTATSSAWRAHQGECCVML